MSNQEISDTSRMKFRQVEFNLYYVINQYYSLCNKIIIIIIIKDNHRIQIRTILSWVLEYPTKHLWHLKGEATIRLRGSLECDVSSSGRYSREMLLWQNFISASDNISHGNWRLIGLHFLCCRWFGKVNASTSSADKGNWKGLGRLLNFNLCE